MAQMTLKRLMELSGVDMNAPKVTMLIEADQRVTELVKRIEDHIVEFAHEHGEASGDEEGINWAPPSWRSGRDIWNEVQHQIPDAREAAAALEALIGHEKTLRLVLDIANSIFDETQQDTSPEPYLG